MARSFTHAHDVIDLHTLCLACEIGGKARPGVRQHLFRIADDMVDLVHCSECFRLCLRGTARDDQARIGVFTAHTANFLAGLAYCLCRDRAGIDHNGVGDASLFGQILHRLRFIGIQPTA